MIYRIIQHLHGEPVNHRVYYLNMPSTTKNSIAIFLLSVVVGLLTMYSTTYWSNIPEYACHDTIELVKGKMYAASCDNQQSLSYLRDYTGEQYIICRCGSSASSRHEVPQLPDMPTLLLTPDEAESLEKDDTDTSDENQIETGIKNKEDTTNDDSSFDSKPNVESGPDGTWM